MSQTSPVAGEGRELVERLRNLDPWEMPFNADMEAKRAADEIERLSLALSEAKDAGRADAEREMALKLLDPVAVHANMLRGIIAPITVRQAAHIAGEAEVTRLNQLEASFAYAVLLTVLLRRARSDVSYNSPNAATDPLLRDIDAALATVPNGQQPPLDALQDLPTFMVNAGLKPICYLRMRHGKPDWAEDCVSGDDHSLRDTYPEDEGYSVIPLYAHTPPDVSSNGQSMEKSE